MMPILYTSWGRGQPVFDANQSKKLATWILLTLSVILSALIHLLPSSFLCLKESVCPSHTSTTFLLCVFLYLSFFCNVVALKQHFSCLNPSLLTSSVTM